MTPSGPQHQKVHKPAARNFWSRNGTTFLQPDFIKQPPLFSLSMFGGKFYPYHAAGINEKQSDHGLEKFFLQAGIDVLTGVQAAQTVAAILATPETLGASDVADAGAIIAENVGKDALKSDLEKIAEEKGAAEVAEEDAALEVNNAIDSVNDNTVNHIMQEHHDWSKVVEEPTWENVKPIIQEVMENGEESPEGTPNVFEKRLDIGNESVKVKYYSGHGKIQISDAMVEYK